MNKLSGLLPVNEFDPIDMPKEMVRKLYAKSISKWLISIKFTSILLLIIHHLYIDIVHL